MTDDGSLPPSDTIDSGVVETHNSSSTTTSATSPTPEEVVVATPTTIIGTIGTTTTGYGSLPVDVLVVVFGDLSLRDLCGAGMVCRHWHAVSCKEELWMRLCGVHHVGVKRWAATWRETLQHTPALVLRWRAGKYKRTIYRPHLEGITSVTPWDKYWVTTSLDNSVKMVSKVTGQVLHTMNKHERYVNSSAIHGDTFATASYDSSAILWDLPNHTHRHHLQGHTDFVTDVSFSRDGHCLVSTSRDKTLRVWDPTTGACLQQLIGHKRGVVTGIHLHSAGLYASASRDSTCNVWDLHTGELTRSFTAHTTEVNTIKQPDNGLILTGGADKKVLIWDLRQEAPVQSLACTNFVYTLDGFCHTIGAGSGSRALLWDVRTFTILREYEEHTNTVALLSLAQGLPVTGSFDGSIKVWSEAGPSLHTLREFGDIVRCIHRSETTLAVGVYNGNLAIVDFASSSDPLNASCSLQ
ncbi:ribosome assembly protein 4 [Pelomyxa schiedti]|nr:ribosome assembly protein 4 [Pelomyxa schiedti]